MFEKFYPDHRISSAYKIPYEKLYRRGFRGLIFDIDNTLVPHGAPADQRARDLFVRLEQIGFSCCLLSNNRRGRVDMFNKDIGVYSIAMAAKPAKSGYLKAMQLMGTNKDNTVFIGDQLFTDIWGAKRTGILSILTDPINPREEIQIILKRRIEAVVLYFYNKRTKNS